MVQDTPVALSGLGQESRCRAGIQVQPPGAGDRSQGEQEDPNTGADGGLGS